MKHIFIINPAAGSSNAEQRLRPAIREAVRAAGVEAEIHVTTAPGDAERFVRERCAENLPCRFYACGGDGTLNEVANGAIGCDHVEIASVPTGTGNDFIRNFTNPALFSDFGAQLAGGGVAIDVIAYNGRYAVNMINIGFDCAVVAEAARLKKKPFLTGFMAYVMGVLVVLCRKFGTHLRIALDAEPLSEGEVLLVAAANGSFCGGGFKTGAAASLFDGRLDVCIARKLSRFSFLRLVGSYRKGTYLKTALGQKYINYMQCERLLVTPQTEMDICADGEITRAPKAEISIAPHALRFSVPRGCEALQNGPIPLPEREPALTR